MKEALTELQAENTHLKEDADLVHLQSSLDALEKEVSALRTEKKELEVRLAQGSGSLDQVP
jgi:predicted  nucleic acid-binding Zn-ribbon protein